LAVRQEIFSSLKASRQLRKHHLYLLISVYARALDFSACEADLNLMLQLGGVQFFYSTRYRPIFATPLRPMCQEISENMPLPSPEGIYGLVTFGKNKMKRGTRKITMNFCNEYWYQLVVYEVKNCALCSK
jgi:hypothetical protein